LRAVRRDSAWFGTEDGRDAEGWVRFGVVRDHQ